MGTKIQTKKPLKVTLDKRRQENLESLIKGWSMDQKKFVLTALDQYNSPILLPNKTRRQKLKEFFVGKDFEEEEKEISALANREFFSNPNYRFKLTGEQNPHKALHKVFNDELTIDDKFYLEFRLKEETDDVYVPQELIDIFKAGHRRHHRRLLEDTPAPKAPFYLVLGPTGSGKTKTIERAIELAIFQQSLEVQRNVDDELEQVLKKHPFMGRLDLESIAPELAKRLQDEKKKKKIIRRAGIPLIGYMYWDKAAEIMEKNSEEGSIPIDFGHIHPNNVQTMWYGETGNKMMNSFGDKSAFSIRLLEEAHALLSVHKSISADVQEETLVATFNIIMDQIERGERNCIVAALTRKGEEFHNDVYRRFMEKGMIIDMAEYWKKPEAIGELIRIEMRQ